MSAPKNVTCGCSISYATANSKHTRPRKPCCKFNARRYREQKKKIQKVQLCAMMHTRTHLINSRARFKHVMADLCVTTTTMTLLDLCLHPIKFMIYLK